jgi:hypothetical protein
MTIDSFVTAMECDGKGQLLPDLSILLLAVAPVERFCAAVLVVRENTRP